MILAVMAITVGLYGLSKTDLRLILETPWLSISQLLSLLGTVLLSLTFVLSSRARWLEKYFGGLDKVNKLHQLTGMVATIMLLNHPLFLVADVLPRWDLAQRYLWWSSVPSYNYGVTALVMMIFAMVATVLIKLPYHVWLKTHDLLGLPLIAAMLHVVNINSDVARFLPLRIWIVGWLTIAILAYVYKVFLYRWLGPKYDYVVKKVEQRGEITEIWLKVEREKLIFKPGQFGFVKFLHQGLKEEHPFSFSSDPNSDMLRLSVKAVGDYTTRLRELKVGMKARIWGAYGKLGEELGRGKEVVCVAGGIGVTPFLSMLQYEARNPQERRVWLFYCTRNKTEAVYETELVNLSRKINHFQYEGYCSQNRARMNVDYIRKRVGSLMGKRYVICGPRKMMEELSHQLRESGVSKRDIVWEDFTFKE